MAQTSSEGSSDTNLQIMPPVPPIDSTIGLLGQQQQYSVEFRGNGEAIVTAKVILSNSGLSPLSVINIRIPRVVPNDIMAFQILRQGRCTRMGWQTDNGMMPSQKGPTDLPVCIEYKQADYSPYSYEGTTYQKSLTNLSGDTIAITLPSPIKPNASGSFLLYYRAMGYAKKNLLGVYDFTFETMKVNESIVDLQVGISVDADYFLAGVKGKTSFRLDTEVTKTLAAPSMAGAVANSRMDTFVGAIGQGELMKYAKNLDALDSYTVRGSYADQYYKLYARHIGISLVIFVVVVLALFLIAKKVLQSIQMPASKGAQTTQPFLISLGLGFSCALLMIGYTLLLLLSNRLIQSVSYEFASIVTILFVLVSIGVYTLLLFVPAILMAIKRGITWGLATFGLTILWLAIDSIIVLLVLTMLNRNQSYPVPMPYPAVMKGNAGMETIEKTIISPEAQPQPQALPDGSL